MSTTKPRTARQRLTDVLSRLAIPLNPLLEARGAKELIEIVETCERCSEAGACEIWFAQQDEDERARIGDFCPNRERFERLAMAGRHNSTHED